MPMTIAAIVERFRGLLVESWPIARLLPYIRNARTHSPEQLAQVAASIRQFGWTNPILVGADGVVIAGHARLVAARQLGMTEVPVIVLGSPDRDGSPRLRAGRQQAGENAGWDEAMLQVELQALAEEDYNLSLLGFSDEELQVGTGRPRGDERRADRRGCGSARAGEVVTVAGDVWIMGDHRLLCGDSTQMDAVEKVLAGGLADMVFTDPPYNVNYGATMKDTLRGTHRPIANDNLGAGFEEFLGAVCVNMLAVTKGGIYVCMSSSMLHTLYRVFTEAGGHWSTFLIWAKNTFTMGRADYQRQYEPILYGWKEGTDHFWCGARDQGDVWFIKKPHVNDLHPTMKPVELVERAIRNSSKSRDTILDPFAGSRDTIIACEKAGRQARLIELEPEVLRCGCHPLATVVRPDGHAGGRRADF